MSVVEFKDVIRNFNEKFTESSCSLDNQQNGGNNCRQTILMLLDKKTAKKPWKMILEQYNCSDVNGQESCVIEKVLQNDKIQADIGTKIEVNEVLDEFKP